MPSDLRPRRTPEGIIVHPDHPQKPGYVLRTFLKFTHTVRSEWDTICYLGWFPPHKPRVRGHGTNASREYFERIEEMKRAQAETQKAKGKWVPSTDRFLKDRPTIDAYLTDAWWDDGKPREVCSLTIRVGNGNAMVSLNDADNEQSISTNGEDVNDALDRLEAYLATGNPSWRAWGKKRK
jgi:hypothetical protein